MMGEVLKKSNISIFDKQNMRFKPLDLPIQLELILTTHPDNKNAIYNLSSPESSKVQPEPKKAKIK